MRFIITHQTNAHWEGGALPTADLVARVGAMLGELSRAGALQGAEGLRPSAQGARLRVSRGRAEVTPGPFERGNELPSGFTILRARSLDEAVEWASREAAATGEVELDIRPVTEPWDIGVAPPPEKTTTRRFMVLRKATSESERGAPPAARRSALSRLIEEATRAGIHVATETMRPSARGRRYKNSRDGVTFVDGPFLETRELIGGYIVISAGSLEDAGRVAIRYIDTVGAEVVDLRELE